MQWRRRMLVATFWTAAASTAFFILLFVFSCLYHVFWLESARRAIFVLERDGIFLEVSTSNLPVLPAAPQPGWIIRSNSLYAKNGGRPWVWLPDYLFGTRIRMVTIPLWIPAAACAAAAATAWKMGATYRHPGACRSCAYDRSGLAPGTPCPECGMV